MIDATLRTLVRSRAQNCCEYCRLPQTAIAFATFHVEHIVARQHGGEDVAENFCLACSRCNLHKGPNLASVDPREHKTVLLFDPRTQEWATHFRFEGSRIVGLTPEGRATVRLLQMNVPRRLQLRAGLLARGELLS